ncbi:unnamed protein product [Amaranthus hypochondriacus]
MEVKKPNKEIPIHLNNSFIYKNTLSPPSPPPPTSQKKKTLTLDPSHPTSDPDPNPNPKMIRFRECQRNHAAHLGNHVVDGCGEFMPSGEDGTRLALKCAACDCHRNFHRQVVENDTTTSMAATLLQIRPGAPTPTTTNCYISFNKYHKHNNNLTPVHNSHPRAPVMMAFGGGGVAAESSSDDLNAYRSGNLEFVEQYGVSKKRFRTKFSQEQKDKMMEYAEKLGWKMQKQNEVEVQRFCSEVGVKRQVFKVWMHNNKQAMKKKQST